jgi:hypothetical protein
MKTINEILNKQEREIRYQWLAEIQDPVEQDKQLMKFENEAYFMKLHRELEVRYAQ